MKIDIEKFGICVLCGDDEKSKSEIISYIRKHNMTVNAKELILIAENPENNTHPELQTVYAELYAIIAESKKILLTTNSFHFLEAFIFFTEKYGVKNPVLFYTVHNGRISEYSDPYDVMKNLSQLVFDLADLKFEYETERGYYQKGSGHEYN